MTFRKAFASFVLFSTFNLLDSDHSVFAQSSPEKAEAQQSPIEKFLDSVKQFNSPGDQKIRDVYIEAAVRRYPANFDLYELRALEKAKVFGSGSGTKTEEPLVSSDGFKKIVSIWLEEYYLNSPQFYFSDALSLAKMADSDELTQRILRRGTDDISNKTFELIKIDKLSDVKQLIHDVNALVEPQKLGLEKMIKEIETKRVVNASQTDLVILERERFELLRRLQDLDYAHETFVYQCVGNSCDAIFGSAEPVSNILKPAAEKPTDTVPPEGENVNFHESQAPAQPK